MNPTLHCFTAGFLAMAMALTPATLTSGAKVGSLIATIKAVGAEGAGNVEAGAAWRELVQLGPKALPDILTALDDANPTAANWLRNAVDAIAERELAANRPLPAAKLEEFVRDTRHTGSVRRLA